jgi:hypothetical protein
MIFRVQTGLYKFPFVLLGLACQAVALAEAGGYPVLADPAISSVAAANQPVSAHLPAPNGAVETIASATPAPPKQQPLSVGEMMPTAMVFHDAPVGMVAHIIGARLGQKVEVEANATQPISGDFGHLNLIQALNEAAAKAGLAVIDEGAEGLHLIPPDSLLGNARSGSVDLVSPAAISPIGKSADGLAAEKQREAVLKAADEKRIELLRLRAKLLLQEADR